MNRIKLVLVMVLWGSLGVFTRSIPLSALSLAFLRALIALPVLFAALKMKNTEKVEWRLLKPYIISGSILGFGWLTLFYGYKHTSISSAVILYNMCPVYVMIAAPLLLKEAISKIQIAVVFFSFLGLVLIVGQNLSEGYGYLGMALSAVSGRPSHKLCKPPERCKIESTDQEVLLWQEEIEIRNGKQSGKR